MGETLHNINLKDIKPVLDKFSVVDVSHGMAA